MRISRREDVSSEKLKSLLAANKHNDISEMNIACPEVTDASISRLDNGVGGKIQHQASNKYSIIDFAPKVKTIFDIVRGSVFDRARAV